VNDPNFMLSWSGVAVASLMILVNVAISFALRLGLAKSILVSAARMTVQLAIIGLVLEQLFATRDAVLILVLAMAMTLIAGISAVRRVEHRYRGVYWNALFSVAASAWLVSAVAVLLVVRPKVWYDPHVLIPMLGMVLGNSLTAISLALDRFLDEIKRRRGEIEMLLTLGATRWESCRETFASAAKTAMMPILNTMSVTGLVSLPGMMTGQILGGALPMEAVRYQIMIMFLIAAAIAMGVTAVLGLTFLRVTSPEHRIRWEAIQNWK
jgi:putative ABC transport system permease protein